MEYYFVALCQVVCMFSAKYRQLSSSKYYSANTKNRGRKKNGARRIRILKNPSIELCYRPSSLLGGIFNRNPSPRGMISPSRVVALLMNARLLNPTT
jgi:hypothetical protein